MKKNWLFICAVLFCALTAAHPKAKPARHKKAVKMGSGVNPYPIQSINGDTTPNQVFITNNAATAYITSNGAGVTTFYFPTGGGGGSGTVTSVSVASANGLSGTVANPTTTPAITLATSVTGVLKGNGTAISAQTTGDLTDGTSDGISVGSGTGAVLGSGTTITQQAATTSLNGYLTSANWNTFNSKLSSINSDATATQTLSVGTSGSDFAITDPGSGAHVFNLPNASATARGVVSTGAQIIGGLKTFNSTITAPSILVTDNGTSLDTSSIGQLQSTTKGFLFPRMTTSQVNSISSPAEGLEAYDTTLHTQKVYDGTEWVTHGAAFVAAMHFAQTSSCQWSRVGTDLGAFSTTSACPGPTVDITGPGPWTPQTTDANLPQVTINSLPPGIYVVTITGGAYNASAADISAITINDGVTSSGATIPTIGTSGIGTGFSVTGVFMYAPGAGGNKTFSLWGSAGSGTLKLINDQGNVTTNFIVERYF